MDTVERTPTGPRDYAAITVVYGTLLAAVSVAARARGGASTPRPADLPELGAATFALSRILAQEKAETWLREPFVEESASGERRPRGRRLRYAIGELLSCTRCLGAWSALGLVAARTASPAAGRTLTTVLAASAVNDFLQTGFAGLRSAVGSGSSARARERGADRDREQPNSDAERGRKGPEVRVVA